MTKDGYESHKHLMDIAGPAATARTPKLQKELIAAFEAFIITKRVKVICFEGMNAAQLAEAICNHPMVLKPLLVACNIAGRAIERDLGIQNIDTYKPRLTPSSAAAIAGYLKSFLPPYLEIPTLCCLDRVEFIDKEIRKGKGAWEKGVLLALNQFGKAAFKKRKFLCGGDSFELDAASPLTGVISIGVDVKRIEARRDIHKRIDEIVNKARKFKETHPSGKFAAIIYYPFVDEHTNVVGRLRSDAIDSIQFASSDSASIANAVRFALKQLDYCSEDI